MPSDAKFIPLSPGGQGGSDAVMRNTMLTFKDAVVEFGRLSPATRWVTTREIAKDSFSNLAVVSALLLTMCTIQSSGAVGLELDGVDQDIGELVFNTLMILALASFFIATLITSFNLIHIALMENDACLVAYVEQCGYFLKLNIFVFLTGLIFYITAVTWQFLTLAGLRLGVLTIAVPLFLIAVTLVSTTHAYMVVHNGNVAAARSPASPRHHLQPAGFRSFAGKADAVELT